MTTYITAADRLENTGPDRVLFTDKDGTLRNMSWEEFGKYDEESIRLDYVFLRPDDFMMGMPKRDSHHIFDPWQIMWVTVFIMSGKRPALRMTFSEWKNTYLQETNCQWSHK